MNEKQLVEFGNLLLKNGPSSVKQISEFGEFLFSNYRKKMFQDHPERPNKDVKESMGVVYHSDISNFKQRMRKK